MENNKQIRIKRQYENCSGCRRCEITCSLHHEGKIWPEASRIRIFMFIPGVEVPHLCFQCEDYPCVEACPEEALSVNSQNGAINTEISKCSACGLCIDACPGKVPHLHPEQEHIVICDLCEGNPKCVETCQKGLWNALLLVEGQEDSFKATPKTPKELTYEVAKNILGENIIKEVIE